ncbi:MAG TPA: ABC transporter permease [Conexibacter sp.]|jgi:putative ABC transport system permease protein
MRPSVLPWLYWLRLRKWPVQEALAGIGIATGVALLFAVQVANSSVTTSVERTIDGITGSSQFALTARAASGFSQSVVRRVQAVDGVQAAAPVVIERASVAGPDGTATVELVGVTSEFAKLNGRLLRSFGGVYGLQFGAKALVMPEPVASQIGVAAGDRMTLQVFGRSVPVRVAASVGRHQVGPLADSPVIVGSLPYVQSITGLGDRVTHILVAPRAGEESAVHAALARIADDRFDVTPSDNEAELIRQAAGPTQQSTGLFAAISLVIGVLFAFNAMLLTVPERRRFISELRLLGFSRSQLSMMLVFDALVLGAVASLLGLVLGDQLSRHVFHAAPGYLAFAFPVGHERIVSFSNIAIAFAGGVGATLVATGRPLADVFSRRSLDTDYRATEEPSEGVPRTVRRWLLLAAAVLTAFAMTVFVVQPSWTIAGIAALGIALVLVLPSVLTGAVIVADRASYATRAGLLSVAASELRANATRATALAATGALAVFGSVAIEGAHQDLLRGLDRFGAAYVATADIWVSSGGDENALLTAPFAVPPSLQALGRSDAVASARMDRGGFVDVAGRRVWVIARGPSEPAPIPSAELVDGSLAGATLRLRDGGAAIASVGLASHLGVSVGGNLRLPTPSGTVPLQLAATTTNLGWSPGTLLLNGDDYRRLWRSDDVTAVEIDLNPGTSPAAGHRLVQSALGPGTALTVETSAQRLARIERLSRQGLDRLSQISRLILLAAAIAMAAAMSAAVWQQRRRLAVLRMHGFDPGQVWRVLLLQSALVLTVGAALGALFGLAGQLLATRWVTLTTGFPSHFSPAFALAGLTFAGVSLVALLAVTAPGFAASRVSPALSFQGD